MESRLQIRLLGPPAIFRDGRSVAAELPAKAQALLYYLAKTGKPQPRATLAALLWGDLPDDAARGNLRKALAAIREAVGPCLHDEASAVALDPAVCASSDAAQFEALLSDPGQREAGLALYGGDFLDGFYVHHAPDFEEWMLAERDRLHALFIEALLALALRAGEHGNPDEGIATARRVLALEPWREEAHRLLMRLLAESGQRSAALAQYEACRRALQEELGVEPGQDTAALVEAIRYGDMGRPIVASLFKRSNLPVQATPFVGRARELAEVLAELRDPDCRLLALVGPGGIGKSRLALAAAQAVLDSGEVPRPCADGVWFVPLTGAADLSGALSALAAATGFRFYGEGEPKEQMLNYLREKEALLVLDSFEHLTPEATGSDACLAYLDAILATAPRVKLLVTSRAGVNLSETWTYRVNGMALPPGSMGRDGDSAGDYDAVRLFVQCARRADARFTLDADRECVLRICRLADGAPLALEMAAAWLGALPARHIADEIEQGLDILTTRKTDIPARHRSMRAVFEHSWAWLMEAEREVLARLAVFRGCFSAEAAETVAGASLPLLAMLVEKSLVQANAGGYYSLHELLRQFAAEKLAEVGQTDATRDAHSGYYLSFVAAYEADLESARQVAALDAIAREIENVRAAWRWAVSHDHWDAISDAVHPLYTWHYIRGQYRDGCELFRLAADRLNKVHPTAMERQDFLLRRMKAREASLLAVVGNFEDAEPMLRSCITSDASPGEAALCLTALVQIARQRGRPVEARDLALRALDDARQAGEVGIAAMALGFLCLLEINNFCRYDEARRYGEESLALARRLGRPDFTAWALGWHERLAFIQGAYEDAVAHDREAVAIGLVIGDPYLCAVARRESRDPRMLEALRLSEAIQIRINTFDTIRALGVLLQKEAEQSAQSASDGRAKRVLALEICAFVRADPRAAHNVTVRAGWLQDALVAELPPDVVAAAIARGRARSLEDIVAELLAPPGG